jgi:hypothetical protein
MLAEIGRDIGHPDLLMRVGLTRPWRRRGYRMPMRGEYLRTLHLGHGGIGHRKEWPGQIYPPPLGDRPHGVLDVFGIPAPVAGLQPGVQQIAQCEVPMRRKLQHSCETLCRLDIPAQIPQCLGFAVQDVD